MSPNSELSQGPLIQAMNALPTELSWTKLHQSQFTLDKPFDNSIYQFSSVTAQQNKLQKMEFQVNVGYTITLD